MKRTFSFSLALLLTVLSCFSCGGTESTVTTESSSPSTESTSAVEEPFAGLDLDGYRLRILNPTVRVYEALSILDYDEQTGDNVEDAIYNRNRFVEETYNMTLEIVPSASISCQEEFTKSMSAGADEFDAAFLMSTKCVTNIAAGFLYNLYELDGVDLEQPWWYPIFNQNLILEGNKLYQADTAAHFMGFDQTVACYFNKNILETYNLELPYDKVRSGDWTYDEMLNYMKQCINLNGDESFNSSTGNSTLGATVYKGWLAVLTSNADGLVKLDEKGSPYYAGPTDKFYDYIEKLSDVFVGDGHWTGDSTQFSAGRVLFSIVSIGSSSVYRYIDHEYGILPAPKLNQSDDYRSPMGVALMFCIPSTSTTAEKTAEAMNVLSYHSYRDVFPAYYQSHCYKGLRDDDSIEMLDIISKSRWADLGCSYGWTYSELSVLCDSLLSNNLNAASYLDSIRNTVQTNIDAVMKP